MVFSSLFFLYFFFALCIFFYFITKNTAFRNLVLTVFSLIFYAWGEPVWVVLLLFSSIFNYICGILIEKGRKKGIAGVAMSSALIVDLGLLGVFKYSNFIIDNFNHALSLSIDHINITLPIGISFFTFQTLSYVIDVYWEKVEAQKNPFKFMMYVSLFPQLVAGPIVRYATIAHEIDHRTTTAKDLSDGITRIAMGLGKKVILADNLSVIVDSLFAGKTEISELSVLATWYGVIVYAMQIYFDFSGYSDMAIGMGLIFGFHFDENFKHPFLSKDVTEFWQRWHISLGSFFKDYLLYLPMFGKRRTYLSLFLVWFCTGLWHGASWNYIIWGLYFGVFILFERSLGKKRIRKIPVLIRHIYGKIIIIIGFGIFYFENLGDLKNFLINLVGANGNALTDNYTFTSMENKMFLLIGALICCFPIYNTIRKFVERRKNKALTISYGFLQSVVNCALLLISSIMLVDATNHPFLYFRF